MKEKVVIGQATNGHRWTNEELTHFTKLWLSKKTSLEVAKELKVSLSAVNKIAVRLRKNGFMLPYRRKGHQAGMNNKLWTQSEVEYLLRRREEGATSEEISSELDRTFYGVLGMLQSLRKHDINYKRIGSGKRKLWDTEKIQLALLR